MPLITAILASLPFGGGDAAEPAGETPAFRPYSILRFAQDRVSGGMNG